MEAEILLPADGYLPRHSVTPPQALLVAMHEGDSAVRKRLQRTARPECEELGDAGMKNPA